MTGRPDGGRGLLLVAGTLLVDEVLTLRRPPAAGTQQRAVARRVSGGGQVWHTARAAAVAGADVAVTGHRGDDAEGAELARRLTALGVRDALVAVGRSRRAVVLDSPPHERAIVSLPEEAADALPPLQDEDLLARVGWVHLDGYGLDARCGRLLLSLASWADARGVPVSLEPPSLAGLAARRERLPSLPRLSLLSGRPEEVSAVLPLLAASPRVVVEHDGPRPVTWSGHAGSLRLPVPRHDDIDTLGAGDRFTGGLLAAVLRGADPAAALRAGIEAAGLP